MATLTEFVEQSNNTAEEVAHKNPDETLPAKITSSVSFRLLSLTRPIY